MSSKNLPSLTEADIRELAADRSFERGKSYYNGGAITDAVLQGDELIAECEGSDYEPYQVSVTFDENGVADTDCTCPYDWGGVCKHVVALLLYYVHNQKGFCKTPSLEKMLADRSKEDLIAIINEMLKRQPKLRSIIEVTAATQKGEKGKPIDVSAYRRQAGRVMGYDSPHVVEKELKALRDTAKRFAKSSDYLNAGAIYHAVLEEAVEGYDDMMREMDYDGDICVVIDDIAEGMIECLKKGNADNKTRMAWLETLLDAEVKDLEMGGIDFVSCARGALLQEANDEEWKEIERRVRGLIPSSREWERECLVSFLTERMEEHGQKKEANNLIREMGSEEQQIYLLIEEKKISEAVSSIRKIVVSKPGLLTDFADALVEAKASDEAVTLVMEDNKFWKSKEWLAKYFRTHGTKQEALDWQLNYFLNSPSVDNFKTLRELGKKVGNWEQVRVDALKKLEGGNNIGSLIEIALHEGDVARALELLPRVRDSWSDYEGKVAKAAEEDFPKESIAIYKKKAEKAISGRTRNAYSNAAYILKDVKRVYEKIKAKSEWTEYIKDLRAKYANLPALQDELNKALK
jgi:uncharacterized Zn finger protein